MDERELNFLRLTADLVWAGLKEILSLPVPSSPSLRFFGFGVLSDLYPLRVFARSNRNSLASPFHRAFLILADAY